MTLLLSNNGRASMQSSAQSAVWNTHPPKWVGSTIRRLFENLPAACKRINFTRAKGSLVVCSSHSWAVILPFMLRRLSSSYLKMSFLLFLSFVASREPLFSCRKLSCLRSILCSMLQKPTQSQTFVAFFSRLDCCATAASLNS